MDTELQNAKTTAGSPAGAAALDPAAPLPRGASFINSGLQKSDLEILAPATLPKNYGFSLDLARLLCAFSQQAYAVASTGTAHLQQCVDRTRICSSTGAAADVWSYWNPFIRVFVVAFQGSCNAKDFVEDARIDRVRTIGSCSVHRGFKADYDSLRGPIREILCQSGCPVFFTGHSLGGALAALAALDFDSSRVAGVYTFGKPRIGNTSWHALYNSFLGNRSYRLVMPLDIVPRLPGALLEYRHEGHMVLLPAWGGLTVDPGASTLIGNQVAGLYRAYIKRDYLEPLADHGLANYQNRLRLVATNP